MTEDPASTDPIIPVWEGNPGREVWVVDETKSSPPPEHKKLHREVIVYSVVRIRAETALALMRDTERVRTAFSADDPNRDSFKSGELWRAYTEFKRDGSQAELAKYADVVAGVLTRSQYVAQLVTTHHNIESGIPSGKLSSRAADRSSRRNTSRQYHMVGMLVLDLVRRWSPVIGPIDIVIDRAEALGLSPRQEGIKETEFNIHSGQLKKDSPEVRIIPASDKKPPFRDLLFLPDFFGYLVRDHAAQNIGPALRKVLSMEEPFYVVPYDLPAMVRP